MGSKYEILSEEGPYFCASIVMGQTNEKLNFDGLGDEDEEEKDNVIKTYEV